MPTFTAHGLPDNGLGQGPTTHFQFTYEEPYPVANVLLLFDPVGAESDWNIVASYFNNDVYSGAQIQVQIASSPSDEGFAWGPVPAVGDPYTSPVLTITPGDETPPDVLRYLLSAAVAQAMILLRNAIAERIVIVPNSIQYALSFFAAALLHSQAALPTAIPTQFLLGNLWMSTNRTDYINGSDTSIGTANDHSGCVLLFYNYLQTQLEVDVVQIFATANNPDLGAAWSLYSQEMTENSDPFNLFSRLLSNQYPSQETIPTAMQDNPFPIAIVTFAIFKSEYGHDEVSDVISFPPNTTPPTPPGLFRGAFWVTVEGLSYEQVGYGGIAPVPSFQATSLITPAISLTAIPQTITNPTFSQPDTYVVRQVVRYSFDILFTMTDLNNFPGKNMSTTEVLDAPITISNVVSTAQATLEFTGGLDPYFVNYPLGFCPDLVVFTATPALNNKPLTFTNSTQPTPQILGDSDDDAFTYIQNIINVLNSTPKYTEPSQPNALPSDAFNDPSNPLPVQTTEEGGQAVTSFNGTTAGHNNYTFALARVRLQGLAGDKAENVRVFFRLFKAVSPDTGYNLVNYPSQFDSGNTPIWPLIGSNNGTMPFFATSNAPDFGTAGTPTSQPIPNPNDPEYGPNGVNNQAFSLTTQGTYYKYFGCFLNVYGRPVTISPTGPNNSVPIEQSIANQLLGHHCLVAQVAYSDAPISIETATSPVNPNNCNLLAQRNLIITSTDPGLVPQLFDLMPTVVIAGSSTTATQEPDELMIDWGTTPPGSTASFFLPQVDAKDILQLAAQMNIATPLSAVDAHTIQCTVINGTSYIPIPTGVGQSFAGLFTIDVPVSAAGDIAGQQFDVFVSRLTTLQVVLPAPTTPPPSPKIIPHNVHTGTNSKNIIHHVPTTATVKFVSGTFQLTIPVSTATILLPVEESILSVYKYRFKQWPVTDRWYPVLRRYLGYLCARVDSFGGDAATVPSSATGVIPILRVGIERKIEVCGKVCSVQFDCAGEIRGFVLVLDTCDGGGKVKFPVCEASMSEVLLKACRYDLWLCVGACVKEDFNARRLLGSKEVKCEVKIESLSVRARREGCCPEWKAVELPARLLHESR